MHKAKQNLNKLEISCGCQTTPAISLSPVKHMLLLLVSIANCMQHLVEHTVITQLLTVAGFQWSDAGLSRLYGNQIFPDYHKCVQ